MPFTELNSIEHFIIERLAGVNLNQARKGTARVAEAAMWRYVPSDLLAREITDVLLEKELKAALRGLNRLPRIRRLNCRGTKRSRLSQAAEPRKNTTPDP